MEKSLVQLPKFTEGILVGGHILVMIFSACGNLAALIIVYQSKAPKRSTKFFLMMLAISDLLMTMIAPPTEIAKMMNTFNEWIFGSLMCRLVPFCQLISATMSAMCLLAIAAERNFLIVRAMSCSTTLIKLWQKWIIPSICASIILIPIGCALPQIWHYELIDFVAIPIPSATPEPSLEDEGDETTTSISSLSPTCDIRHYCIRNKIDSRNIIYWSITGSTYFFLLVCFLVSYISIYKFVKKHGNIKRRVLQDCRSDTTTTVPSVSANYNSYNGGIANTTRFDAGERHRKTLKLILGLILLHLCCRAPNWIYLVIINVKVIDDTQVSRTILECFHFLSIVNCALDPFLYVIWNHSLRAPGDDKTGNDGSPSVFQKSTGKLCRYCVCCCRNNTNSGTLEGALQVDGIVQPVSSLWLRKTHSIYHVSNDGGLKQGQTN